MLIRLDKVNKIYSSSKESVFWALKNIDLSIDKGEFISIIGPSGSGKSTLLNMIGLLDRPTSGKIFFEDKDTAQMNDSKLSELRNKKIGFVFQSFNLVSGLSLIDNIMLPCEYSTIPKSSLNGRKALEIVGLLPKEKNKPSQLSVGEQQRAAIARAIINDPDIILADEPTGNLDSFSASQVLATLQQLNQQGKTLILVTHNLELAKHANRMISIVDGRINNERFGFKDLK